MTLKIELKTGGGKTTIYLTGRLRAECLDALHAQLADDPSRSILDLEGVTLVDVEVVRFLNTREEDGFELLHCPAYVREWMKREKDRGI